MSTKVLFVDDEPNVLAAYERNLRKRFVVDTAISGELGLNLICERGPYAVVVADMQMPVMNGWQFALEFVGKFDHKSPIIVMTAAADAKERAESISAIGWIGKPFVLEELLRLIKKYERE